MPAWGVTPNTAATASGTAAGSPTGANSTSHTPSENSPVSSAATCTARRVFPTPPTPVRVTSRWARTCSASSFTATSRPTKLVVCTGRFPGTASNVRNGGKLDPQPVGAHLVQVLDTRQVAQPMLAQIDQVDARHHRRRGRRHQDLAAVAGGHHPRRPVQHRTEVVLTATLGLAGGDPHAHRQPQRLLRLHRRVDRGAGRAERGAHPVTGVLEQPTPMRLDRRAQHLVMADQRGPHRLGVGLPATRRTLDIGEQERHRPRRRPNPHKARAYAFG